MRIVLAAALALSCSRASSEGEAKQWAKPPPSPTVEIPADLAIAVSIDGATGPAITSATLKAAKPDFADADRMAWRVPTLVPAAGDAGTVEAVSRGGVSVRFEHPTAQGLEPVLFLTRRGEVVVAAVDPKDPFPRYHGQGGRLHRAGDPMPRLNQVAKLAITRSTP